MRETELERINVKGMKKEWNRQVKEITAKGETHKYPEHANTKHAAIMRLHISETENAMFRIIELMRAMEEGAKAYYPDIDSSEFFFSNIKAAENEECYAEIYFEDISDKVVNALGHISDIICEKYKKKRWFELIMIKQKELERTLEPILVSPFADDKKKECYMEM